MSVYEQIARALPLLDWRARGRSTKRPDAPHAPGQVGRSAVDGHGSARRPINGDHQGEFLFENGLRSLAALGRLKRGPASKEGKEQRDRAGRLEASVGDPMEIKPLARSGFHGSYRTACRSIKRADVGRLYWGRPDAARRPTPRTVQSAAGLDRAPRP